MSASTLLSNTPKVINSKGENYFVCDWTGHLIKRRFGVCSKKKKLKGCFASPGCVIATLRHFYNEGRIDAKEYKNLLKKVEADSDAPPELLPIQSAPPYTELDSFGGPLTWNDYTHQYDHDKQVQLCKGSEAIDDYLKKRKDSNEKKNKNKRNKTAASTPPTSSLKQAVKNLHALVTGGESPKQPTTNETTTSAVSPSAQQRERRTPTRYGTDAALFLGLPLAKQLPPKKKAAAKAVYFAPDNNNKRKKIPTPGHTSDDEDYEQKKSSSSSEEAENTVSSQEEEDDGVLTQRSPPQQQQQPYADEKLVFLRESTASIKRETEQTKQPVRVYSILGATHTPQNAEKVRQLYNSTDTLTERVFDSIFSFCGKQCIALCNSNALLFHGVGQQMTGNENKFAMELASTVFDKPNYVITSDCVLLTTKPLATLLPPENMQPKFFEDPRKNERPFPLDNNTDTMPPLKRTNITHKISISSSSSVQPQPQQQQYGQGERISGPRQEKK